MPRSDDAQREAFEEWLIGNTQYSAERDVENGVMGEYIASGVRAAWKAWKGAMAQQQPLEKWPKRYVTVADVMALDYYECLSETEVIHHSEHGNTAQQHCTASKLSNKRIWVDVTDAVSALTSQLERVRE